MFGTLEPLMDRLLRMIGRAVPHPFLKLPIAEAIARYGSDKPDLRCGMEISDLSAAFRDSPFPPFRSALDGGGEVRGFVIPGAARYSRRELDELGEQAKQLGAAGLVWARAPEGTPQSPALKTAGEDAIRAALQSAGCGPTDLLVMAAAGISRPASLSASSAAVAGKKGSSTRTSSPSWVVDFPMFEWLE